MDEQNKDQNSASESDEVSLVDLLAVILKYRRLVIALPLVVTLLAGLYLYALPLIGKGPQKGYMVEVSVSLRTFPEDMQNRISVDIVQSLNTYFTSVPVQSIAYTKCFPEEVKGFDKVQLSTFIRDELLAKRFKCAYSPESNRYSLSLKSNDAEAADRYLVMLWSSGLGVLRARLNDAFTTSIGLIDRDLTVFNALKSLDAGANSKANLLNTRQRLVEYQADTKFPVEGEPYHLAFLSDGVSGGKAKKLVLCFFASLFIALLAAFCCNAIDRIKQDPTAMEKLKHAMHS